MEPGHARLLEAHLRAVQERGARSTGCWQAAKRMTLLSLLAAAFMSFYLLSCMVEAINIL